MGPRDNAGVWRPDIEAERRAHLKAEPQQTLSLRGDYAANDQNLGQGASGDRPQSPHAGTPASPGGSRSSGWVAGGIGAITIAAMVWMLMDFGPQSVPPNVAAIERAAAARAASPAATTPSATPSTAALVPRESLAKNEVVVTGVPAPASAKPAAVATTAPTTARAKTAATPRASAAASTPRARAARPPSDARIRSRVQARLEDNRSISGRIGVETEGGMVRLTGYTLTPTQARLAEREARSVPGVRGVKNEIRPRVGGPRG